MLYTNINTNLSIFDWGLGYSIGLCDLSHHLGRMLVMILQEMTSRTLATELLDGLGPYQN